MPTENNEDMGYPEDDIEDETPVEDEAPIENEEEENDVSVENSRFLKSAAAGAVGGTLLGAVADEQWSRGAVRGALMGAGAGLVGEALIPRNKFTDRKIRMRTRTMRKKKMQKPATGRKSAAAEGAVTNTNQENTMNKKLKDEERARLVSNLTTNCASWKHEGSEKILNGLSDEQLLALNEEADLVQEIRPVIGKIMHDFDLPGELALNQLPEALLTINAAAFDGSGEDMGGGDSRGNSEDDNPDEEYAGEGGSEREDEEGEYAGDDQDSDNHEQGASGTRNSAHPRKQSNTRRKPMTTNQWLASAPPEIQVVVRNAMRKDAEEKEALIDVITANANNPYSEEQLFSMTTEQLRPLSQLAASARQNQQVNNLSQSNGSNRMANFLGAAGAPRKQAPVHNAFNPDEGLLIVPHMTQKDWAKNAESTRD